MGCGCDNKVDVITDTTSHNCVILVLTLLRFHFYEEINRLSTPFSASFFISYRKTVSSPFGPIKNFSVISVVEKLVGLRGHRFQQVRTGHLENWN